MGLLHRDVGHAQIVITVLVLVAVLTLTLVKLDDGVCVLFGMEIFFLRRDTVLAVGLALGAVDRLDDSTIARGRASNDGY